MGIIPTADALVKRAYYCDSFGRCYNRSTWSNWGRWVLVGCLIIAFILFIFIFLRFTAARRRRRNLAPYAGTAWMAPAGSYPPAYNPNANTHTPYQAPYQNTTPAYGQQEYGNVGNQGQGYNANQNQGYELNNGGSAQNYYAPPRGPPPQAHVKY